MLFFYRCLPNASRYSRKRANDCSYSDQTLRAAWRLQRVSSFLASKPHATRSARSTSGHSTLADYKRRSNPVRWARDTWSKFKGGIQPACRSSDDRTTSVVNAANRSGPPA